MRRTVVLFAVVTAALAMSACGDEGGSAVVSFSEGSGPYQRASGDEALAGAAIVTQTAAELYAPLAARAGDANLAYSPLSIASVLAQTRTGVEGTSADQIDAFGGSANTDGPRAVAGAAAAIEDQTGQVQRDNGEIESIELTNANALWGQSGTTWKPAFLTALKSTFDTGMWTTDYREDPGRSRYEINDWVAEHTREQITDLLPPDALNDETRLTPSAAIWFQAPWPSDLADAGTQPFATTGGSGDDVEMLTATGAYRYQKAEGWQAVALPFAGDDLAMTVIVPDADALDSFEVALDADTLHQAVTGGEPTPIAVTFPRFDLDQRTAVGDALKELGVTEPFDEDTTDFEPMSTDPVAQPLHLTDMWHRTTVAVDQHGTETLPDAVPPAPGSGGDDVSADRALVVDRPFLFVIHDVATGTPLLLGRISDPTAP